MTEDWELGESPEDEYQKKLGNELDRTVVRLSEHFDSVVILTTRYCSDRITRYSSSASGNHFARMASAEHWLNQNTPD